MRRQEVGSPLDQVFQGSHPAPVHLLVPEKKKKRKEYINVFNVENTPITALLTRVNILKRYSGVFSLCLSVIEYRFLSGNATRR